MRTSTSLSPLLATGKPVDWWYCFKFNAAAFPGCGDDSKLPSSGIFGGALEDYEDKGTDKYIGLQYAVASSENARLVKGTGCLGNSLQDPVGATYNEVFNGDCFYVVWNDQFYGEPIPNKESPWGHSKGMLAWNEAGEGFVMQVSTPAWPGSGNKAHPRKRGNTLGHTNDNDIEVSQGFFALKLTSSDVQALLKAMINAKVATEPDVPQIVRNGGPEEVQELVEQLGHTPHQRSCTMTTLSSGVRLISKPSTYHVPPWQLVSAQLGGVPLRVASWWEHPEIPSAPAGKPGCWHADLGTPGAVEIATSGTWDGKELGLLGEPSPHGNHAKLGVSTDPNQPLVISGDMNQQGSIAGDAKACQSSQNGRGGLFFVLNNETLWQSVSELLKGQTAPVAS